MNGEETPPLIPGAAGAASECDPVEAANSSEVLDNSDGDVDDLQKLEEDGDFSAPEHSEPQEQDRVLHPKKL